MPAVCAQTVTQRDKKSKAIRINMDDAHGTSRIQKLPWVICFIGALFYCYAYFLRISPSTMTHELSLHFHISATALGTLAAFYYYAYTPMQLAVGIIVDRYGARFVLSSASLLCTLGVFVFVAAPSLAIAELGRFIIGLGSAFAYVSVLKLATIWLPANRFALVAGSTTALGMIAAIFADLILTDLVHTVGYKNALYSTAFVGIFLCVLIFSIIRDHASKHHPDTTKVNKKSTGQLIIAMLQMLKKPQMWIIGIIGLLLYMPASVFMDLWGIPYLKTTYQLTSHQAAHVISMIFVGWIISSPIIGAISDQLGKRKLPLLICSMGATITVLILFYTPNLNVNTIYTLFLLFGAFCGVHPLCFAISKENNPTTLSGTAVAITNTLIMLGGLIFQPLVGKLLDAHWQGTMVHGVRLYSASDYTFALSVVVFGLILSTILILFVHETHCEAWETKGHKTH
jgi:sugar phosphate permease